MPLTKRARPASLPSADSASRRKTRSQSDIQSFARVSKPAASPAGSKKRKASTQDVDEHVAAPKLASCKKLRRPRPSQRPVSETPTDTPTKGASTMFADLGLSTPVKPLKLQPASDSSSPAAETPLTSPCSSTAPSFRDEEESSDNLPQAIQDLVHLNSSFLSALSLHYAHNGTASPVDLHNLTPSMAKVWGKRKVTVEDVRRTLGVMQISLSSSRPAPVLKARTFHLSDYGRGKICVEQQESKKQRAKRTNSVVPQHIDEKALNALFETEINMRWSEYRCKITPNSKSPSSVQYFISQLPLADITECVSLGKVAPLLAKGQRRLEEFKAAAPLARGSGNCFHNSNGSDDSVSAELEHPRPTSSRPPTSKASKASLSSHKKSDSVSTVTSTSTAASTSDDVKSTGSASSKAPLVASAAAPSRATSLLDRILAKQAAAAAGPSGPTPEERARQAALQRCEDVLATLSLLAMTAGSSSASSRISFPFPRLIRDIQSSSRSPLSSEEIKKVIGLLSSVIVPGYVSTVRMGTLEAVVVDKSRAVGGAEVRKRLAAEGMQEL